MIQEEIFIVTSWRSPAPRLNLAGAAPGAGTVTRLSRLATRVSRRTASPPGPDTRSVYT